MKAVQKFKNQLDKKRPSVIPGPLGKGIYTPHSSSSTILNGNPQPMSQKATSIDIYDRGSVEVALTTESTHREINAAGTELHPLTNKMNSAMVIDVDITQDLLSHKLHKVSTDRLPATPVLGMHRTESGEKGHAHDPLDEEPLFLGIGNGSDDTLEAPHTDLIAESPTAAEFNIYDRAYQEEVDRIRASKGDSATVYLTRRVDKKKEYKGDKDMIDPPLATQIQDSLPHHGFKGLLDTAREKYDKPNIKNQMQAGSSRFSEIAAKAMENTKSLEKDLEGKGNGGVLEGLFQKAVIGGHSTDEGGGNK